jgi:hypothetical protein
VAFDSFLQENKGIYIMRASNPGKFGAQGHGTLYYGTNAYQSYEGHDAKYFNAAGGTHAIFLWKLP